MNGIIALIKEAPESSLTSSCENTARGWPSKNQELGFHQTLNLLTPLSCTTQTLEL